MEIAAKKEETKANELLEKITESFNNLSFLAPDNAKGPLKERFAVKGRRFKVLADAEKLKKLQELKTNTTPNPKPDRKDPPNERRNKEWIKKSKYQRMKRKVKKQPVTVVFNY